MPLAGGYSTIRWGREEALGDPSRFQAADIQTVQPGFFETMRTPVIAGRTFTQADNAPDRNYVIVDSLLAAKAFPREPAVGKRILIRARTPEPEWVEIIRVVSHQRATSLSGTWARAGLFHRRLRESGCCGPWAMPRAPGRQCGRRCESSIRTCWLRRWSQ